MHASSSTERSAGPIGSYKTLKKAPSAVELADGRAQTWPEAQFPLMRVGSLVLNQNPGNYFNDVEQLAFSPGRVVPGALDDCSCSLILNLTCQPAAPLLLDRCRHAWGASDRPRESEQHTSAALTSTLHVLTWGEEHGLAQLLRRHNLLRRQAAAVAHHRVRRRRALPHRAQLRHAAHQPPALPLPQRLPGRVRNHDPTSPMQLTCSPLSQSSVLSTV